MASAAFDGVKTSCEMKLSTEYRKRYKQNPICRQKNFKPPHTTVGGDMPMDSVTTTRKDYVAHVQAPACQLRPELIYIPHGETNMLSFYRKEYRGAPGDPAKSVKKPAKTSHFPPFENQPTYRSDYRTWQLPKRFDRPAEVWCPASDNPDWKSTTKASYGHHLICPRRNYKPEAHYVRSDSPFDYRSIYKSNFIAHSVTPRKPLPKEEYTGCVDSKYIHRDKNCDYY